MKTNHEYVIIRTADTPTKGLTCFFIEDDEALKKRVNEDLLEGDEVYRITAVYRVVKNPPFRLADGAELGAEGWLFSH